MRDMGLCVSMLLTAATVAPAAQEERQMGGVGILVFEDAEYRGPNATFRQDVTDLRSFGLNDRISSLRVSPRETWEVCEHSGYRGRCQVFYGDEPDLRSRGWSDIISSMRRVDGEGRPPVVPPNPPVGGLELFDQRAFGGDRRLVTGAVADLRTLGFNDRAQSLRLPRSQNWEVCVDAHFRGCLVVNTDSYDLDRLGMNRRISSVRPWGQGGGYPPPGPMRLILYDERGFRGPSFTVTERSARIRDIYGSESARVTGSWQVCDRPQFTGQCAVITSDVPDLRAIGLRGRVQSAQPFSTPY